MRLIFAGTPEVAVPTLRTLVRDHEVVGVLTMPDARGRRGATRRPSPVAVAATELGIELYRAGSLRDGTVLEWVRELAPDAIAVVAYGALVPETALQLAPYGWINLHFSLLPEFRGAAPVQRCIEAGASELGMTVFQIDQGLDTGPIFAQQRVELSPRITSGQALAELAPLGAEFLSTTLTQLASGSVTGELQPERAVSYAKQLTPAQGKLDFRSDAFTLDRKIRAFTPDPGAWCNTEDGLRIKILAAHPRGFSTIGSGIGTDPLSEKQLGYFAIQGDELVVTCGSGELVLDQLAPAGKRPMSGVQWLRGWRGSTRFEVA